MKQKMYILNGRRFYSFEDAVIYCEKNNLRITNTVKLDKNIILLAVTSI